MSEAMEYHVDVSVGADIDIAPTVATFKVDEDTAKEIVKLSQLVKEHGLNSVEKFDYRADFLQYSPQTDPEDAEQAGQDNSVRTEHDCLVVTDDRFWFSAYIKHTDILVSCEGQSIQGLREHFGLSESCDQGFLPMQAHDQSPQATISRPRM